MPKMLIIGDWISFPEIDLAHTPKIRLTSIFENSSDSEGVFQNCTNVRLENKKNRYTHACSRDIPPKKIKI